jgi:hypothetical protein
LHRPLSCAYLSVMGKITGLKRQDGGGVEPTLTRFCRVDDAARQRCPAVNMLSDVAVNRGRALRCPVLPDYCFACLSSRVRLRVLITIQCVSGCCKQFVTRSFLLVRSTTVYTRHRERRAVQRWVRCAPPSAGRMSLIAFLVHAVPPIWPVLLACLSPLWSQLARCPLWQSFGMDILRP